MYSFMCYFSKLEHISSQFAQSQEQNTVKTNFRLSRGTPRALAVTDTACSGRASVCRNEPAEPGRRFARLLCSDAEPGRRFAAKMPLRNAAEPGLRFAKLLCNAAQPGGRFARLICNVAEPGFRLAKLLCNAAEPGGRFAKLLCNAAEPGRRLPLTDCAVAERGAFVKEVPKLSVEICLYRLSIMADAKVVLWAGQDLVSEGRIPVEAPSPYAL